MILFGDWHLSELFLLLLLPFAYQTVVCSAIASLQYLYQQPETKQSEISFSPSHKLKYSIEKKILHI